MQTMGQTQTPLQKVFDFFLMFFNIYISLLTVNGEYNYTEKFGQQVQKFMAFDPTSGTDCLQQAVHLTVALLTYSAFRGK